MIKKEEVIEKLTQFSSPLGPLESIDARLNSKKFWIATIGDAIDDLVDVLLNVLIYPPATEDILPATREDFEFEMSELLTMLGQRDPIGLIKKIGPLLTNDQARPISIEVIGGIRVQEGIPWLTPLVKSTTLTEDELIRLACSLGEIAGPDAKSLLKQMRDFTPVELTDVLNEIDIALKSINVKM